MSEWLENKGRKRAPYSKGTMIEVVKLSFMGVPAELREKAPEVCACGGALANDWARDPYYPAAGDIVRYRLHVED